MTTKKIAVALSLFATTGLAAAAPAHAQTQQTPRQKYTLSLPGIKVSFAGRTPYGGGATLLLYKANFATSPDQDFMYGVVTGEPSARHAAADNGALFHIAATPAHSSDSVAKSHSAGAWVALVDAGTYCRNGSGRIVGRTVITVIGWDVNDSCAALSGPGARISRALVARAQGTTFSSAAASAPVYAPAPAPVATPVPEPQFLVNLSGDQNTQSDDFTVSGSFTVAWSATVVDTDVGMGLFSADLYSTGGSLLDSIALTTQSGKNAYREHADCSGGCYIKITVSNMTYGLNAL